MKKMNNTIRSAFDEIHADKALKQSTKEFISEACKTQQKRTSPAKKVLIPLCAALIVVFFFGITSYNIPVAAISLDTDSSVELTVNRYNRVIGATGFDSDAEQLLEEADIKHLCYNDAVNTLIENTKQENIVVTVNGKKDAHCKKIADSISDCHSNVHCYSSGSADKAEAERNNLSYGKYKAYLILKGYDKTVTVENIRNLSVREIYALIEAFQEECTTENPASSDVNPDSSCDTSCESTSGNKNGHGYGKNHSEHHN